MELEPLLVSIKNYFPWLYKFLPDSSMYGVNEAKEINRNEIRFRLFPKDYMQWHLFTGKSDFPG